MYISKQTKGLTVSQAASGCLWANIAIWTMPLPLLKSCLMLKAGAFLLPPKNVLTLSQIPSDLSLAIVAATRALAEGHASDL